MSTKAKRLSVTFLAEWESDLKELKKEYFYDKTYSDLIRFLIALGLKNAKSELKNKQN